MLDHDYREAEEAEAQDIKESEDKIRCRDCGALIRSCRCEYCQECRTYHSRPVWQPGRPCRRV